MNRDEDVVWSIQYNRRCVIGWKHGSADAVIDRCRIVDAIYFDGEDDLFVVELREDVGPELWTKRALCTTKFPIKPAQAEAAK